MKTRGRPPNEPNGAFFRTGSMPPGKADQKLLERVVYRNLGFPNKKVLVGPRMGFDNAVVRMDAGRVLILTTDPISVIPAIGMKASAWLSVHLVASDYVTSACSPEFACFEYNFPPQLSSEEVEAYLTEVGRECKALGVTIVAGHTGTYPGAGFTVIGGGTMMGLAGTKDFLDPSMAEAGDAVLVTKGAAVEATSVLANSFPDLTERKIGRRLAAKARGYVRLCSTVQDALVASSVGIKKEGVTSMHDATEGGVLGGLSEMASASGNKFVVRQEAVPVSEETRLVCSVFGIDPLVSVSEGTLLLTCREDRAETIARKLRRNTIPVAIIGRVSKGAGLWLQGQGNKKRLFAPRRDPFWGAYERALAEDEERKWHRPRETRV